MFKQIIGFENYSVNENGVVVNTFTNHIKSPCYNNMATYLLIYINIINAVESMFIDLSLTLLFLTRKTNPT